MAVAVVARLRRELDEVDLQGLGEELLVARTDAPPRAALLAVAGVADLGVVDDDGVVTDPVDGELCLAEVPEAVASRTSAL